MSGEDATTSDLSDMSDDMIDASPRIEAWTLLIGEGPQEEAIQVPNRLSTPLILRIQDEDGALFHYSDLPGGAVIGNGPIVTFNTENAAYQGNATYDFQNGRLLPSKAGQALMTAQITINGVLLKATRAIDIIEAEPRFSIPRVIHTPFHHAVSLEELLVVTQSPEPPQSLKEWFTRQTSVSPAQVSLRDDTMSNVALDARIASSGKAETRRFTLDVTLPNQASRTFELSIFFEDPARIQAGPGYYCTNFYAQSNGQTPTQRTRCFGANQFHQLGTGEGTKNRLSATDILLPSGSDFLHHISSGNSHACALDEESHGYCWGSNALNQSLRDLDDDAITRPTRVPTPDRSYEPGTLEPTRSVHEKWAQIVTGVNHSCGLSHRGYVYCWGQNDSLQLGWLDQDENIEQDPDFSAIRLPANMMDERIHHLSAGANHTCALSFAGELLCWGNNSKVQARPGSEDAEARVPTLPSVINFPNDVTSFERLWTGPNSTCAQGNNGEIYCWGSNEQDNLVPNKSTPATPNDPLRERTLGNPKKLLDQLFTLEREEALPILHELALGQNHSCAIVQIDPTQPTRTLHCWGQSISGALGRRPDMETDESKLPQDGLYVGTEPLLSFTTPSPVKVAVNDDSTCLMHSKTGETACWGAATQGQLGNNLSATSPPVVSVQISGYDAMAVDNLRLALGRNHTCLPIPNSNNKIAPVCWGNGMYGQTGRAEQTTLHAYTTDAAALVSGLDDIDPTSLTAYNDITCAVRPDGNAHCWGSNHNLQISSDGNRRFVNRAISLGNAEHIQPGRTSTCLWSSQNNRLPRCIGVRRDGSLGNAHRRDWENDWTPGIYDFEASILMPDMGTFDYRISTLDVANRTGCLLRDRYVRGSDTLTEQSLWCWGNMNERFAIDLAQPYVLQQLWSMEFPSDAQTSPRFTSLEMGNDFVCLLSSDGEVHCLGRPPLTLETAPLTTLTPILSPNAFTKMRASDDVLCLQPQASAELVCYGDNRYGQLGILEPDTSVSQHAWRQPTQQDGTPLALELGLTEVIDFEVGPAHGCAIGKSPESNRFDKITVSCWGLDTHGQSSFTTATTDTPANFRPPVDMSWYTATP